MFFCIFKHPKSNKWMWFENQRTLNDFNSLTVKTRIALNNKQKQYIYPNQQQNTPSIHNYQSPKPFKKTMWIFIHKTQKKAFVEKTNHLQSGSYCWWKKSCTSWGWQFIPIFPGFSKNIQKVVVWDLYKSPCGSIKPLPSQLVLAGFRKTIHRSSIGA